MLQKSVPCCVIYWWHTIEESFMLLIRCKQFKTCYWCSCHRLVVVPQKERVDMTIN